MSHPFQYSPSTTTGPRTINAPLVNGGSGGAAGTLPRPGEGVAAGDVVNGRPNPTPFSSHSPAPPPAASLPHPIPNSDGNTSLRPSVHNPQLPAEGAPPFAITSLPICTRTYAIPPGQPFPAISPADQARVKSWMETDLAYEKSLTATKRAQKVEMNELGEQLIRKQDWLGGEGDRPRFKTKMEGDRLHARERGKRGPYRKEVSLLKEQLRAIALQPEVLVPIRLEYEYEAYKLRDTFTWNLRETIVTPEIFASHLCEDLRLPQQPFYREIVSQIKRHIEDARLIEHFDSYLVDDLGPAREESRRWFENTFKKRRLNNVATPSAADADEEMHIDGEVEEKPLSVRDLARPEVDGEGLRVLIKLDITLDSVQLVDQFEWDMSDPRNSPEDFADTFAADLGLSGEFRTAIAHSIREQVDVFVKSLCLLGHVHGLAIPDDDLRREFLPSSFETFRSSTTDFTPSLSQLTADEIERNDKEREREVRRKRRQTKGRGVTLPDRDPVKTHRTLVPKPSNTPLHPYQDARGETVYPLPEMSHPYPIVAPILPEKPLYLETVPTKGTLPANFDLLRGSGNRLKRLRQGENGSSEAGSSTGLESSSRLHGDVKSISSKTPTKPRKPPVILPTAEELGLHEHIINGAWFCANCGVPETCAVGRRKGPSGKNSLCGSCGKYFHRFRKNRPCVYTTDLAVHFKLMEEEKAALAKNPPASLEVRSGSRPPGSTAPHSRDSSEDPETPGGGDSDSSLGPSRPTTADTSRGHRGQSPDLPFVQIGSPDSDMSSLSSAQSPAPDHPSHTPRDSPAPPTIPRPAVQSLPPPPPPMEPLPWMLIAAADLRSKQKDDRFEIIPRPRPPDPSIQEWRVRCLDCPGKLYNLGPGETMDNFSVHFKNRIHRTNVEVRLKGGNT